MAGSLEIAEVRERLRYDLPFWASHCATILNEDKVPVRLVPRPWQARTKDTPPHMTPLDEALEKQRAAGQPMRAIILKARKLGFSTWVQAKMMQRCTQFPFQYAITAAHLRSSAGVLADMATLMYERLPTFEQLGLGFSIRPQLIGKGTTRNGSRFMTFGDRKRPHEASLYETLTAGARGGGRATTPNMMHGSEVAHYEDEEYLTGLLNALPMRPETMGVLESTANGFNFFHKIWETAVAGQADPTTGALWAALFYGWQDNPYNARPFMSDQARDRFERTIGDPDGGGDEEEPWLVESFNVTLEQLNWRRAILHGPECRSKLEVFHQEHPATPEQAFIGSGNPVFAGILVSRAMKAAEAAHAPVEGVLRGLDWRQRRTRQGTVEVPQRALWVPGVGNEVDQGLWGTTHRLAVWEHPLNAVSQEGVAQDKRKPDGQYIAFIDVAQGEGATAGEKDYHAVQVLDHITLEQVARYRSRVALHDLPLIVVLVGLYYNTALLAPEVNGPGIALVDALAKDYRYPRIYRRRRAGDDRRGDERGQLLGWDTNLRTKPLMEQTFGQALKEGTHGLRCVQTVREATTYVSDDRGRHGAQKGAFDDLLMAYMGAHRVAMEMHPRHVGTGRKKRPRFEVDDSLLGY